MKLKPFYIILLLLSLGFGSCNLLEDTSPNDIDATEAIKTGDDAESALVGIYSSLQDPNYYGGRYLLFADALGGNATTGGFDNPVLDEIGNKTVTASNVMVEELWLSVYLTISNCNYLLEALPAIEDLDAERKGQIEGQARAIRAMAHFDLLRYFGYHWDLGSPYGIPVVQTVQTIEDVVPRATVAESYDFITSEMEASIELLDASDRQVQYMNPMVVQALLSRIYLYKNDKTKAAEYASKVLEEGGYTLLVRDAFANFYASRRTTESIFELSFDNQNRSDYNTLTYNRPDALRTELFFLASPSLAQFFEGRNDLLREKFLDYEPSNNDESITSDGSGRTQKYRGETNKDNPAFICRLAEIMLIKAEALGMSAGLPYLNDLRQARGLVPVNPSSEEAFQTAILDERKAELNFEGHIFFDLARTGRAAEVLGDDFRAALPIPQREINATGGAIVQNPEY